MASLSILDEAVECRAMNADGAEVCKNIEADQRRQWPGAGRQL